MFKLGHQCRENSFMLCFSCSFSYAQELELKISETLVST